MGLEYEVYPNFYKKYKWVAEEDNQLFTGRNIYLQSVWRELCNVAGKGPWLRTNVAFLGPRKLGKTAFLRRCYNVAFWEQNDVIPFYYCFSQQNDMDIHAIANDIIFKFLQQATVFFTKNNEVLGAELEDIIFLELKKKKFKRIEHLEMYWEHTKKKIKEEIKNNQPILALQSAWHFVKMLSSAFSKKAMLIIDEYQKTYQDLQQDGITIPCHETIAPTVNNDSIFTIISGSKISMLAYNVLTPELHNRIPDTTFYPLWEEEAHELILKYAGKKGYKNIEKDVYNMVGGNPHYIKMLFSNTLYYEQKFRKPKKWSSLEELRKIYNFEVLNDKGAIFTFWEKHFTETNDLLNGDAKGQKGLTLKILKYIAEKEEELHMDELEEVFPQIKDMKKKMLQLRKADLIQNATQSRNVFNFCDVVLPVVLTKMHQKLFLGTTSRKALDAYKENWFRRDEKSATRIDRMENSIDVLHVENIKRRDKQDKIQLDVAKTRKNISDIKIEVNDYFAKKKKAKASKKGKASIIKGAKAESKFQRNVQRYIKAKKGIFSRYQLVGSLHDINVKLTTGRGVQVDLFGELKSSSKKIKPQKCILIGEMKDRKSKVTKKEAQAFIDKAAMLRANYKMPNSICTYVATGGFWKSAIKVLEENKIFYGTSDKFIKKL